MQASWTGGGIDIPPKPAAEGVMARFPAGRPAHAGTGGQPPPVAETAGEDHDRESDNLSCKDFKFSLIV